MSQSPGCTVQKRVDLCISHRFLRCFPLCVAFCIGFYSILGDDVHANVTFVFSFLCSRAGAVHWWGGVGVGGVMTSMRVRLLFSLSCVHALVRYIAGEGGWGGGRGDDVHASATFVFSFFLPQMSMNMAVLFAYGLVAKLLLKRYQLLCQPCRFLLLHFGNVRHAKSTSFKAFQTKTSKLTLKINKNQRRKAWYLRHFCKNLTKKNKNL